MTITGPLGPGPLTGASAPGCCCRRSKQLLAHTGARPPTASLQRYAALADGRPFACGTLLPPHPQGGSGGVVACEGMEFCVVACVRLGRAGRLHCGYAMTRFGLGLGQVVMH